MVPDMLGHVGAGASPSVLPVQRDGGMNDQAPTPETDAAQWGHGKVTTDFARRLERERNAAMRGETDMAKKALEEQIKRKEAEAEVARLRDVSERLAGRWGCLCANEPEIYRCEECKEALAAVRGGGKEPPPDRLSYDELAAEQRDEHRADRAAGHDWNNL